MILGTAYSVNNVEIRLTEERWEHILEQHPLDFSYDEYEVILDAVEDPDFVLRGQKGSLIAVAPAGRNNYLSVIYRELGDTDGFIITAYYKRALERSSIIWRKNPKTRRRRNSGK